MDQAQIDQGPLFIESREEYDDLAREWIRSRDICALDFEGWNIVRLVQLCDDDEWMVIDFGQAGENWFAEVAADFELDQAWVAFHSKHEKKCFKNHGGVEPTVWDVANLRRAIEGGGHMNLKQLVKLELGIELDKEEQGSDWDNGELTDSQLDYAADDALYTWQCWSLIRARADDDHMRCFDMLDSMTDAVLEMEANGLALDKGYHRTLIKQWSDLRDERETMIRDLVTPAEVENLNSGKQITAFMLPLLADDALDAWPMTPKTGLLSTKNKDLLNMSGLFGDNPLGQFCRLLAERSTLEKYLSSFGETLIFWNDKEDLNENVIRGRVNALYNIAAAITCRFSCSKPNLQQIPRDRDFFGERLSVRRGFIAADGRLVVSFDYSGIEMVMMALISGDETLLHDVIYGDPHAVMAEYVAGRKIDKTVTEDYDLRQSMKAVNFGIIYGTTALGLAGRQGWAFSYAEDLMNYWASRYPKAWNYRFEVMKEAKQNGYIRMLDGGTIAMDQRKPGLTKCANYPVQRAALSVMARAIVRHKDSMDDLRARYPRDAKDLLFCSTIHDALIDEAKEDMAPLVMQTMKHDMLEGYFDMFPMLRDVPEDRLLEGGMGPSWGELEEL